MKINNKLFLFGMAFILSLICICMFPQEVQAADSQGNFVIVLDPGHGPNKEDAPGSNDPGAIAGGVTEANVTMKLAQYAKEELEQYEGVKVYLTRYNNCPTIYNRVEIAKNYNADLLVSLHINSGGGGASRGAAIWVTQDKTQVEYNQKASEAASIILRNISLLGIQNNGVQTRSGKADEWYDSGVVQDYYGIIRYAQRVKMRSLLVEHCFIDNDSDRNYINSDEKIKRLAQADVKGIVEAYQLNKKSENKKQLQSISMQQSEINIQMNLNSSYFMPLTYTPSNVSNKTVYWYTSDSSIATVNEGTIYAKREGEAIITAISGNRQKIAKCKVIVSKPEVPLTGIKLKEENVTVEIGKTGYIGAIYNPSDASDKVLYWSSSDESVAKVNEGVITAIGRGTVMLTATSRDGGKTATCEVTVTDPNYKELKSIKMNQETVILKKGENGWIGVTYNPSDASDKVLYWSSSDESVAKVNEGVVTAIGEGKAILTATARAGGKTASCTVTVENPNFVHIDEIKMKTEELNLNKGENGWVGVTYSPSNASNKVLTWKSSNEEVVTVREGNVKAVGEGKAVLTATSEDGGKTTSCIVTVVDPKFVHIDEIKMKTEELNLNKGENGWIGVTYNPSNASNKVLTWKSSNEDVAIVREGNVKAVGEGTAILTATSEDGGKTASCKVIVTGGKKHLENIALKTTTLEMKPGEGKTIYVEYNPSDVEDKVLYWTSNNEKVVTVREGYVKAVGEGTTTITATSRDGNKTATCKITVSDGTVKLQNIKLSSSTEILKKGEQKTIYVTYNPSNVTDKTLYWTSSDEKVATIREGFVKAIGDGVATLTATSRDGEKKVSCQVVVINKSQEIESISLKTTKETIEKGEEKTIYAVYNPSDVKDKTLYWISSNTSVVTVEKGRVKAVGKGTATITAVSRDGGKTASCEITVK